MVEGGWVKSACVVFAAAALMILTRCSSKATDDGEACLESPECASHRCTGGYCEGSDCACEGADCRGRSSCLAGWLCTRADSQASTNPLPVCRRECSGVGTCGEGEHCGKGVCQPGGEPFGLAWDSFPRKVACSAKVPCKYAVHVTGGATVKAFTWNFGDAPPVDTEAPMTEFTYDKTGTYTVRVKARSTSGATADLSASEVLCEGGRDAPCDASGAPCCEGVCTARGLCE